MILWRRVAEWSLRLLAGAFFGFVGYWKAFGPYAALAEHHAWVAGFPAWFARGVGWSEILCALALILPLRIGGRPSIAAWAAAILILNQLAAMSVHVARTETAALPQNVVIIAMLVALLALFRAGGIHEQQKP